MDRALGQWLATCADLSPILALGYFGSYARNQAGPGSDLDVLVIVPNSPLPFHQRSTTWDFLTLPVAVEAQIYTWSEWQQLPHRHPRDYHTLLQDTVWLKPLPEDYQMMGLDAAPGTAGSPGLG